MDNEPAPFTRTLIARAWARFGLPATWRDARLPVLLEKDGNYARRGFRLQRGEVTDTHADVPYIVLDLDAGSLSDTFLHEGGHVLHEIATRGRRPRPWWSPFPHTTFAVTDPLTARGGVRHPSRDALRALRQRRRQARLLPPPRSALRPARLAAGRVLRTRRRPDDV